MYGKIVIRCEMKVVTGLHIGASSAFSAIGAVDSPVIRDPVTQLPMVPGSSLKGEAAHAAGPQPVQGYSGHAHV